MEKKILEGETYFLKAYGRYPIVFDHGNGVNLYDTTGKEYLDFYSGIGVNSFGYNYPMYVEKVSAQIGKLTHVSNYFYTVPAIDAANHLAKATGLVKTFFTNSGTEATEGALKLARKYYYMKHKKADSEIISLNHSFHGRSTGSVKLTGNHHYQEAFGPLIEGVKYGEINNLESIVSQITEKTAAIIIETVQGEGGVYPCTKEFLQGVRAVCDEKDIVLILDEVQCGMGRTGTMMAYEQYDIKPDIVCLAKGIAAGIPVGAFVANEKLANAMEPGDHGSTYGGNPLAGVAISTVFEILEETKMLNHINEMSKYLDEQLAKLHEEYDCIVDVRGLGLMKAVEFNYPVKDIIGLALEKGLIIITAGANVVRLLPPFIIEKSDIDKMIKIFKECINESQN